MLGHFHPNWSRAFFGTRENIAYHWSVADAHRGRALGNGHTSKTLLGDDRSDASIQETQWVEAAGGLMVMLATHPPSGCRAGNVEVHVTQQSCGTTAVVEFNLDPTAQGTGCYFV